MDRTPLPDEQALKASASRDDLVAEHEARRDFEAYYREQVATLMTSLAGELAIKARSSIFESRSHIDALLYKQRMILHHF